MFITKVGAVTQHTDCCVGLKLLIGCVVVLEYNDSPVAGGYRLVASGGFKLLKKLLKLFLKLFRSPSGSVSLYA